MWEVAYGNGQLTVKGSDLLMPMSPITDEESWYVQSWLQELGFGATPLDYNINDDEFNKSNWRNVPAIYINDGSVNLTSENMKDPNNYKIVTLPWYKGGAAERVASGGHNIPEEIVRRRYVAGISNLFRIFIPEVDFWNIYDNSQKPRIQIALGGREADTIVFNNTLYQELQNYVK